MLVLRGDAPKNEASLNPNRRAPYAIDLLKQVVCLNQGVYLKKISRTAARPISVSAWRAIPKNISKAPNLETDLMYLKAKVDAGAEYITTQMFFDNQKYFDFVKACREKGINVPVIPGLKPITNKKQLTMLPKVFHVDLPTDFRMRS